MKSAMGFTIEKLTKKVLHVYFGIILYIWRILHECSCFIEFIKRVGEKR